MNQLNGKTKSASFVAFHATSMVHFIENVDEHIVETYDLRLFFQKQNVFLNQNCPTVSFVLKIENTAAAYPPPSGKAVAFSWKRPLVPGRCDKKSHGAVVFFRS